MPHTGKKKDSQETSRLILLTAKNLFAEHGVNDVSMHQVAKAAQIGQGTLYRRYANKSDLCMELMKDNFQKFTVQLQFTLAELHTHSVHDRLLAAFQQQIRFFDDQFEWISVIGSQQRTCESNDKMVFNSPPYQYLFTTYQSLLSEAQHKGEIIEIDINFTAHMLITNLFPDSFLYLKEVLGYTPEQIALNYCQTSINPLFKKK